MNRKFNSFAEFYPFYLSEHRKASTRLIHCAGTLAGLVVAGFAIGLGRWSLLLVALVVAYGPLFLSHYVIEHNHPATFKNPFYSFLADWRMLFETLTGKLPLKNLP